MAKLKHKGKKDNKGSGNTDLNQFFTKTTDSKNKQKNEVQETTPVQTTVQLELKQDSTNPPIAIEIGKVNPTGSGKRDGTCTPTPTSSPSRSSLTKKQRQDDAPPSAKGTKDDPMAMDDDPGMKTPQLLLAFDSQSKTASALSSGSSLTTNSTVKSSDNPAQRKVDKAIGQSTSTMSVSPEGNTPRNITTVLMASTAVLHARDQLICCSLRGTIDSPPPSDRA